MEKFEFNISHLPVQAKELLHALRELNASGKKFAIIPHISLSDKISEKTVIQIVGEPGFYNGLLHYIISDSGGRIKYTPDTSENSGRINMVTIEEL